MTMMMMMMMMMAVVTRRRAWALCVHLKVHPIPPPTTMMNMGTRRARSAVVRVSCARSRLDSDLPRAAFHAWRAAMRIS